MDGCKAKMGFNLIFQVLSPRFLFVPLVLGVGTLFFGMGFFTSNASEFGKLFVN